MNRTKEKGDVLAKKFGGKSVGFWEIENILKSCDVCICSVSAPHYVVELELIEKIMKQREKDLIMIDISMPRNIHPEIAHIKGVRLISLDELDKVVEVNVEQRKSAISEVQTIIAKQCREFHSKINGRSQNKTSHVHHLLAQGNEHATIKL